MAFRMQSAVPELADLSTEPETVYERYGPESKKPGSFAANCILARRLAERGVRFIQLYHRGWDQHGNLPSGIKSQCHDTDQPTGALLAMSTAKPMTSATMSSAILFTSMTSTLPPCTCWGWTTLASPTDSKAVTTA
mgnify:CR=1 FL=1